MDLKIEKDEETIALLQKEIKDKEQNLHLAATFGNKLIAEKEIIKLKLIEVQTQNEKLEQENYSLQRNLDTQTQLVISQNAESEFQISKIDDLTKKLKTIEKEASIQKQKYNNIVREKSDLENNHEELKIENNTLKNKIKLLEQQLCSLKEKAVDLKDESTIEEEQPDYNLYKNKCIELENILTKTQHELEEMRLKENSLNNLVRELKEAVSDRDKELRSYSSELKNEKEFSAELQCEIESMKTEQVDVNRRGNSMFSELDDRRKYVENEYKSLSQKYQNILKNYQTNKEELVRCKGQISLLLSKTSKQHQDDYIKKLESMLSDARREIDSLTLKLAKATKELQNRVPQIEPVAGDKYNYLRIMTQNAQQKTKDVQNELATARLKLNDIENSLMKCSRNLYKVENENNELKVENLKLKQEMKDFTTTPDSATPQKKKQIVEAMPGFQSKASCETVVVDLAEAKENNSNSCNVNSNEKMKSDKTSTQLYSSNLMDVKEKSERISHAPIPNVTTSDDKQRNVQCAQQ